MVRVGLAVSLLLLSVCQGFALNPSNPWADNHLNTDLSTCTKKLYYSSTDGDDSDCSSPAKACRTLSKTNTVNRYQGGMCALFKRGSVFNLKKNTYEPFFGDMPSGTSSAPTIFGVYGTASDPMPRLVFPKDAGENDPNWGFKNWFIIEHLQPEWFSVFRPYDGSSNWKIRWNKMVNFKKAGVQAQSCKDGELKGRVVSNFEITDNYILDSGHSGNDTDYEKMNGEGVYISSDSGTGCPDHCGTCVGAHDFTIARNEFSGFNKEAIDIKQDTWGTMIIEDNYIHKGSRGIGDDFGPITTARSHMDMFPSATRKGIIRRNWIDGNERRSNSSTDTSDAIQVGDDWEAYNNVVVNNKMRCLGVCNAKGFAYNNTCYNNSQGFLVKKVGISYCTDTARFEVTKSVKGNIQDTDKGDAYYSRQVSGNLTGTSSLFVSPSSSLGGDYHLKSTASSAIDELTQINGIKDDYDKNTRPVNGTYDYGAYEYGGSGGEIPPPPAKDQWVDASRPDDNGPGTTPANAWKTIGKCIVNALTAPNSSCTVKSGTYTETITLTAKAGTSIDDAAYTIKADTGATVLLQPASGTHAITLTGGTKFTLIKGIKVDAVNTTGSAIFLNTSEWNNRFDGVEVYNSKSHGIEISAGSPYNEILNSNIHNNGTTTAHHGILMMSGKNNATNNTIASNKGHGIALDDPAATTYSYSLTTIAKNKITSNGGWAVYLPDVGDTASITNNVMAHNPTGGILLGDASNTKGGANALIAHNTIVGPAPPAAAAGSCISIGSHMATSRLTNNICNNTASDITINGTGTIQETNLPSSTNPLFVDASADDFHLQAGSPAKDTGTDLSLVPDDITGTKRPIPTSGKWDMGAYEAPKSADIKTAVVPFVSVTSGTSQDITSSVFTGITPKGVLIYLSGSTIIGGSAHARMSFGASDATSQWWVGGYATDGLTTTASTNNQRTAECSGQIDSSKAAVLRGTCTLIPGGVRITWAGGSSGLQGIAVLFGGADANFKAGTFSVPAVGASVDVAAGIQPDVVFLGSGRYQDFSGTGTAEFIVKLGMHTRTPVANMGMSWNGDTGQVTGTAGQFSESWTDISSQALQGTEFGQLRSRLTVSNYSATGFRVNNTVYTATSQMGYAAVSLGGLKTKLSMVSTPATPANCNCVVTTAAGFAPGLALGFLSASATDDAVEQVNSSQAGLAIAGNGGVFSASWNMQDGLGNGTATAVPAKSRASTNWRLMNNSGAAVLYDATPTLTSTGLNLTFATNPAQSAKWVVLQVEGNPGPQAPVAPTGFTLVPGEGLGSLFASWDAVPDGDLYHVTCGTAAAGPFPTTVDTEDTQAEISGLLDSKTYYCQVTADNGLVSAPSTQKSATTLVAPAVPTGLACTAHPDCSASCTWNPAAGADSYFLSKTTAAGEYLEVGEFGTTSADDPYLDPAIVYTYNVQTIDGRFTSAASAGSTITSSATCTPPAVAPPPPARTTAVSSLGSIAVSWDAVPSATYHLYRANSVSGPYTLIADPTGTTYTDTAIVNAQLYSYVVTADTGIEGDQSCAAVAVGQKAPATVTGLTATPLSCPSQINLAWTPVSGASSYRVQRSSGGAYTQIADVATAFYNDLSVAGAVPYTYKVAAYNGFEGPFSTPVGATSPTPICPGDPPPVPTGFTATTGTCPNQIVLDWADTPTATSYLLYRSPSPTGPFTLVASPSVSTYTETGLDASTPYSYKVSAYNGKEGGQTGVQTASTPAPCIGTPTIPMGFSATAQTCPLRAVLNWNSVASATAYRIYRAPASTGPFALLTEVPTTTYVDTSVAVSQPYSYQITAFNSLESAPTNPRSITMASETCPTPPPPAPSGVTLTTGTCPLRNAVSWNTVAGATSYYVYRSQVPGGSYSLQTITAGTPFIDTAVSVATPYWYQVSAFTDKEGAKSAEASIATGPEACPLAPPAQPQGMAIGQVTCPLRVLVGWSPVSDASFYRVYRSETLGGPYTVVASPASASYVDAEVVPDQLYDYKVTADNGIEGLGSTDISIKTLADPCPPLPPGEPENVTGTQATCPDQVSLSWDAVSGAGAYKLERDDGRGGAMALIGTTTQTTYTEGGLGLALPYRYQIAAYNGQYGPYSDVVTVTTSATSCTPPPPDPPGFISVEAGTCPAQVVLDWDDVPGASKYHVWQGNIKNGPYADVAQPTNSGYAVQGAPASTTLYWRISTDDGTQQGDKSGEVSFLIGPPCPSGNPPPQVTGVSAQAGQCPLRVGMTWTLMPDTLLYKVYRDGSLLGTTTLGQWSDVTPLTDTFYGYQVGGSNGLDGPLSAVQTVRTPGVDCPATAGSNDNIPIERRKKD